MRVYGGGMNQVLRFVMTDNERTIGIHERTLNRKALRIIIRIGIKLHNAVGFDDFIDQLHPLRQPRDLKLRQSLLRIPEERKHRPSPGGFLRPLEGGGPGLGIQAEEKGETYHGGEQGGDNADEAGTGDSADAAAGDGEEQGDNNADGAGADDDAAAAGRVDRVDAGGDAADANGY